MVASDFLDRFAESVRSRPNHRAVEGPEATLTYAELDRLSSQLANRLRNLGVGPEQLVGVSLARGVRELAALIAVWKAGGAYVPLDPNHPRERLQVILEDAAPRVMILQQGAGIATGEAQCIFFEDLAEATRDWPATPLPGVRSAEQLAYVLFTSGSTGRPKGVEVPRGAFANFLGSMMHTPGMSPTDRLLAITTTSFDIAGLELFLPLSAGATVVIADRETVRAPRLLRARLEAAAISVMQATPATWRLLLEAGWRGDGRVRMLCGGEALSPALADRLLGAGGELWNLYGPTETTVWSSVERVRKGYDRITIGRPIDDTHIYVVDAEMKPLPPGVEGEICIGGSGVARGYRSRADLTAERFVQNPASASPDRIYRTGDLGRELSDGRFECLGRLDHQVKLRGFRVELGEVESALRTARGVAEVLVVADRRGDGDPRLVAYWTGDAERQTLIEAAEKRLPSYMVPSAFVRLQRFPLNTSGKIDRLRLPPPEQAAAGKASRALTELESRIAAVWCDVLGVSRVAPDESFFTLGGTSVAAIQAVARLELELGTEIPLQIFFEHPTVEGIASRLGTAVRLDDPIVIWLQRGRQDVPPLFCLLGVTLYKDLAIALGDDRSVIAAHVPVRYMPGRDDRPTLGQVASRYLDIIRKYQTAGPYRLLGLCFGGIVAYEVARQLEAAGERVLDVVVIDAVLPSALRVKWARRLGSYAVKALREPGKVAHALTRRLARSSGDAPADTPQMIDLPVDGPEVDVEVARFDARPGRLAARLLVVRATAAPLPAWLAVGRDHGWGAKAERAVVCDIPADHLGVLRDPHVASLARAISVHCSAV